jgi:hypothetical protein
MSGALRSDAPIVVALAFIDAINHGDIEGIAALMAENYAIQFSDSAPEQGRDGGIDGWRGYCSSYPQYAVHPWRFASKGNIAAILGATTGSHLDLPDDEELAMPLIWLGHCRDGEIVLWHLIDDTPANRAEWGLG